MVSEKGTDIYALHSLSHSFNIYEVSTLRQEE